jgi:hypothetical protein
VRPQPLAHGRMPAHQWLRAIVFDLFDDDGSVGAAAPQ